MKKLFKYFKDKKFKKLKKVAQVITQYYCEKDGRGYNREDTIQAGKEIDKLGITCLKFKGNKLTITLKRAGYLIGHRGENIDKLKKYLSEQLKKEIKIYIIEDQLMGWLEPFYYDEELDY